MVAQPQAARKNQRETPQTDRQRDIKKREKDFV
jgi:hypothetical protein